MPEESRPLVTVLMPVRNGAAHLSAAIHSILAQSFADFELLILDDGSTDATPDILRGLRDPRVRIVTHPRNLGLIPTLNEGLEIAMGEFIARQDHDDLSDPHRLQKQVEFLRTHQDCPLVGSQALQIGDDGRPTLPLHRPRSVDGIRWYSCFDNPFIHSAVMFRRTVVAQEFGGYPVSLHSEDYALWSRILHQRTAANLPACLLQYREHAASVTGSLGDDAGVAFDAATSAIREQNLRAVFGDDRRIGDDARLLSMYRRPLTLSSARAFLEVFDRRRKMFAGMVGDRAEFREVCGVQLAELAYRLLPVSRWRAIALYRRALVLHPPIAAKLPWVRVLALLVFGDQARALYTRMLHRR